MIISVVPSSPYTSTPSDWLKSLLAVLSIMCAVAEGGLWFPPSSTCARCRRQVTPMEELVLQVYPGLFSPTPPSHIGQEQDSSVVNFVYSPSAQVPLASHDKGSDDSIIHHTNKTNQQTLTKNDDTHHPPKSKLHRWESSKESPTNAFDFLSKPVVPSCCETVLEYVTPPNVTVKGKVYRVVHLRNAFQFIPVAKCRPGITCAFGECVERYRAHWVLIYNATSPHTGPPVSFTPVEVPSHCECLNVGKP